MMAALALALAYTGFTCLCLAMERHYRQVWAGVPSASRQNSLRGTGWLCLVLSLLPCFSVWGAAIGTVAWFGLLSLAGLGLGFLLPYAPRTAASLAVVSPILVPLALFLSA